LPLTGKANIGLLLALLASGTPAHNQAKAARAQATADKNATPVYGYKVVNIFPHDAQAFTQGLFYRDGFLYEGTGMNGKSSLRKVRLETGEVAQQINLAAEYFGEGITSLGDEILQLTWKAHKGFVYRASDFHQLREFSYTGEGWGLTSHGNEVFMSDGTSVIRVLDGKTFGEKRRLKVHDGASPVLQLNELEYVEGEIFANVWHSDRIARISPQSGRVLGWIDLQGLMNPMYQRTPDAVLNGIAYDAATKRLFVTGKLWPNLYEIKIVRK
jgi:glutaminyl-peptide cyclotransferase